MGKYVWCAMLPAMLPYWEWNTTPCLTDNTCSMTLLQNVVLYAGSAADRQIIRDHEFYYIKHQVRAAPQLTQPQCSVQLLQPANCAGSPATLLDQRLAQCSSSADMCE
jgi:hypothetical protein